MVACSLIRITGSHLRAARGLLGWTQEDLSKKSRVAVGTVRRMETFSGPVGARTETLDKIISVLERAGVEFLNDDRPGVRRAPPHTKPQGR